MSLLEHLTYEERQRKLIHDRHKLFAEFMLLGRDKRENRNWDETYFDLISIWLTVFNGGMMPTRGLFNEKHDKLMFALTDTQYGDGAVFVRLIGKATELGIDHYLDAYLAGVPLEDITC